MGEPRVSQAMLIGMPTTMSLSEVTACLAELVDRVSGHGERVTITVHGKSAAVLIAPEDLESLEESLALLADRETMSRLATSEAEIARGEGESLELLARVMAERRQGTW